MATMPALDDDLDGDLDGGTGGGTGTGRGAPDRGLLVAGPPVVALVCSAGGLRALMTVLGGLRADFPGAVIVLQHQQPDRVSRLAAILDRHCVLPVADAVHGGRLRAATVAVVPPGKHALVTADDEIALIDSGDRPPYRPSADLLLTSLALVAPHRSIAVILSGEGHDGATGALALHELGGQVLASDEATSNHFSMPSAAIARDEAVDEVVPLGAMADRLTALLADRRRGPATGTAAVAG